MKKTRVYFGNNVGVRRRYGILEMRFKEERTSATTGQNSNVVSDL